MNIATVRMVKDKGWNKLEDLIKIHNPEFRFIDGEIYKIQLLRGAISLCESNKIPNNEGYLFNKINETFDYVKGDGDLYIIPANFDYAQINIGDTH